MLDTVFLPILRLPFLAMPLTWNSGRRIRS